MVYNGCDMEYAKQVTAEHKVQIKKGDQLVQVWELKASHMDNHLLDCEVYAFAAADILGVRSMHLVEEQKQEEIKERPPEKKESPEESWIKTNENWI